MLEVATLTQRPGQNGKVRKINVTVSVKVSCEARLAVVTVMSV